MDLGNIFIISNLKNYDFIKEEIDHTDSMNFSFSSERVDLYSYTTNSGKVKRIHLIKPNSVFPFAIGVSKIFLISDPDEEYEHRENEGYFRETIGNSLPNWLKEWLTILYTRDIITRYLALPLHSTWRDLLSTFYPDVQIVHVQTCGDIIDSLEEVKTK